MLYRLHRHPIRMRAHFRHSLVVTYAFPAEVLQRLLPAGLTVDRVGQLGFAAVAVVQAEGMRPAGLPRAVGRPYLLVGYRIFCRFRTQSGRRLRGLHILRSDADRRSMVAAGNLLTHYRYGLARAELSVIANDLAIHVRTPGGKADLDIGAKLVEAATPPAGSPFASLAEARRFAGPLPFTFDHEPETGSFVVIEGVRSNWHPIPVTVETCGASFFRDAAFEGSQPILANAFHVADVEYEWRRGVVMRPADAA